MIAEPACTGYKLPAGMHSRHVTFGRWKVGLNNVDEYKNTVSVLLHE